MWKDGFSFAAPAERMRNALVWASDVAVQRHRDVEPELCHCAFRVSESRIAGDGTRDWMRRVMGCVSASFGFMSI
jgi:hypothetical protein